MWANTSLGLGSGHYGFGTQAGSKTEKTKDLGLVKDASLGLQLVYLGLRPAKNMKGDYTHVPFTQTRFCGALQARIGYFGESRYGLGYWYSTLGISLGILVAKKARKEIPAYYDVYNWK